MTKRPTAARDRRLTGNSEDFSELKFDTTATVLDARAMAPPNSVGEMMHLEPSEAVFHIGRLRRFESNPFSYEEAFLRLDVGQKVAKLDLRNTAIIFELRNQLKLKIWEDQQQIEAVAADSYVAGLLGVAVGAPLLFLVRHFLDKADRSIAVFWSHLRPDRYYYTLKFERPSKTRAKKRTSARPARAT